MVPDVRECLDIGSEPGRYPTKPVVNAFPDKKPPDSGVAMRKFFENCDDLYDQLLSAIAEGLGVACES